MSHSQSADITVSKHINGSDWVANAETTGRVPSGWQVVSSRKKTVKKKAEGKAQQVANRRHRTIKVAFYSGKGKFQRIEKISPTH